MAKKEFTADFAKWNGTVPANVRFMIEDPATGQKYYVTYEQILSMDIDIPDWDISDKSGKPANTRHVARQINQSPVFGNIFIDEYKLAGHKTTTGNNNVGIGTSALAWTDSGSFNAAFGWLCLSSNTSGSENSGFGRGCLWKHPAGNRNNAFGRNALYELLTGNDNIGFGAYAAINIASGALCNSLSKSIVVGNYARPKANGDTNEIIIGDNARGEGSNTAILGNSSIQETFLNGNLKLRGNSPGHTGNINIFYSNVYGAGANFMSFAPGDILYASFMYDDMYYNEQPFVIASIISNNELTLQESGPEAIVDDWYIQRTSASKALIETRMSMHKMQGAEFNVNGAVIPQYDAFYNLGNSVRRWNQLFSSTGTISTSDQRVKTPIRDFEYNERNAAVQMSREIGMFKFLDAVRQKGDKARTHIGMSVQRAIEILEQNNLNPFDYAFICYDEWETKTIEHPAVEAVDAWTEEIKDEEGKVIETIQHEAIPGKEAWTENVQVAGDLYSFRYDQLLAFICKGIDERLRILEGV